LSAKYLNKQTAAGRITLFDKFGQRYEKPLVNAAVRDYAKLAKQFELSAAQFALAFVYSRWFTASTIIGATTMDQLKENIAAYHVNWTDEMEQAVMELHLHYFNPAP